VPKLPGSDVTRESGLVEAVVILRTPSTTSIPSPEQTGAMCAAVVSEAASSTGVYPESMQVFSKLHAFSVRAPQPFLDALSTSTDVVKILPNELGLYPFIDPTKE
jgi:hypothetical protein